MNYEEFFARNSEQVARDLLGRLLVRNTGAGSITARITETGAYQEGSETPTRAGMKYSPGRLFLMKHRTSYLFNIATDREGYPSCIEVRQLTLPDRKIRGSGAVTKFLDIPFDLDNVLLGEEIEILGDPIESSRIRKVKSPILNCVGYHLID